MFPFLRMQVLRGIEIRGRHFVASEIKFDKKQVTKLGEDIYAPNNWAWWFSGASGFYLSLPSNVWGIVTYPNGILHNLEGGLHEVDPGVYKLQYVDQHERHEYTDQVSEMTTDGEQLTLSILLHYRVINPLVVLQIDRPVETLMANIQADLAQYIRTHAHNDIAESSNAQDAGKIQQFFHERHMKRNSLSRAFHISNIELKDFTGDAEYLKLRRNRALKFNQDEIAAEELSRQREFERINSDHNLELERQRAAAQAEITALQGRILDATKSREIELERIRMKDERRQNLLINAMTTIRLAMEHTSYTRSTVEIKGIIDELLVAIMSESPIVEKDEENKPPQDNQQPGTPAPLSPSEEKIKTLTNTLRNLLK